ncbi:hypothetical protein J2T10_004568 [Paenarthrobacter nicotinovorans]|uniref:Uncharacterized protein n=1 Tax=Paenarthrobacter nicotinovorans TaxID=29320 RepID=A0ABT9TWZ1_PAENI|nr:hypothetical protein [Paenarthrobacter nicotinovorans]MDQ0104892.1 hypothetical protein [Paenarthrobacter nicotinovorans]GAT89674.1 hypothetical protein CVCC1112_4333 [Paenarthrobacter nicotinovorans]
MAASLGGTKFSTPAVRQGGNTFTSPAVRQGGQSTGDTRGADTGAALAAANAVMHAASVEATQKIALEAQGRNALGQFTKGESADTARGRETHNNYEAALGTAYKYNRQIPVQSSVLTPLIGRIG